MRGRNRSIRCVPWQVVMLLAAALAAQLVLHASLPRPVALAQALEAPPSGHARTLVKGSEPVPGGYLTALYLQAFDNQPGISIPFRELDYTRVLAWLSALVEIDPPSQYALLMASQLYAQVPDPVRQRMMLDFVHTHFFDDPDRRWPWLAHAAIMAKHRLKDMPLALTYARAIAARALKAPAWARQMHIFILEDMGEYEAAKVLLGGLLESGQVTDTHERVLLLERLERLRNADFSSIPPK
jgi:hypothetical protein